MTRAVVGTLFALPSLAGILLASSGPGSRQPTDPQTLVSSVQPDAAPVDVTGLLQNIAISGMSFSADGKHVAYVGNASGRFNLWIMDANGSGARQLLHENDRQGSAVFTHDSRQIVYEQDKGGDELYDLYTIAVEGGAPRNLTNSTTVSESSPMFSHDGTALAFVSKLKSAASTDLAVMSWPSGTSHLLTHETDPKAGWSADCWSPDGNFLYATRRVALQNSDVFRIEVKTGKAENLTSHSGDALISAGGLSPDGKTLLLGSNQKGGYTNIALLDLASKQLRWVTDTQWDAHPGEFAPDGKSFTYTLNEDGRAAIEFVDAGTLVTSTRSLPVGLNFGAGEPTSYMPDGSFYFRHQDSSHPANLYRLSVAGVISQVTHNESSAIATAKVTPSQLVTYKSFDGRLISAFVWIPYNLKRDGTSAAVVMPHGGPTGQTLDSFNGRAILLASRGFVVIAPNVRGSTGYGMEFQKANTKDLGGADLKDEIAGVDFLKATGYVDGKKVGIWGGSYGGFMTLMAIGKTPDLWAAAVDEYGILNWYTMLQHEDPGLQEYEKSLLGDPVKDRAIYEASSPLKYIRNERAPLLVLQGERDIRVPKEEADQVVAILKAEGRTVDAVYYPEEGHGFYKKEHQIDELTRSVAWLQQYLQGVAKP